MCYVFHVFAVCPLCHDTFLVDTYQGEACFSVRRSAAQRRETPRHGSCREGLTICYETVSNGTRDANGRRRAQTICPRCSWRLREDGHRWLCENGSLCGGCSLSSLDLHQEKKDAMGCIEPAWKTCSDCGLRWYTGLPTYSIRTEAYESGGFLNTREYPVGKCLCETCETKRKEASQQSAASQAGQKSAKKREGREG